MSLLSKSMKPYQALVLSGLLVSGLALAQPALADNCVDPMRHIIATQGQGEIKAEPDSLEVSVALESKGTKLKEAREENNRKMTQVRNALKALNIKNMTMKTTGFHVSPIYEPYDKARRVQKIIGYQLNNNLSIKATGLTTEELATASSAILDTALDNGANNAGSLSFYIDDMAPIRAKALAEAVTDAKMVAQAMAQAAGVTVSGVYSIEGYPQYNNFSRAVPMMAKAYAMDGAAEAMPSTPIEVGDTTVTSQVTVKFEFTN